ncbi:hypothetical protein CO613_10030 [Lysobacteraceae bacterium NML07-0707]|nr:hypothetical protein CO613_10030 [Xanthomonadaceae bacterium NML07-0707]
MTLIPPAPENLEGQAVRIAFQRAGRRVLAAPEIHAHHQARIDAAMQMPGSEALQAAVVDMLHACPPEPELFAKLLASPDIAQRLPAHAHAALCLVAQSGECLPRATRWATRWCILATPSLDVPRRALLCGTDDSRTLAAAALCAILAGDTQAENEFLAHCQATFDTLAFMLVRRELFKHKKPLDTRWDEVAATLESVRSSNT